MTFGYLVDVSLNPNTWFSSYLYRDYLDAAASAATSRGVCALFDGRAYGYAVSYAIEASRFAKGCFIIFRFVGFGELYFSGVLGGLSVVMYCYGFRLGGPPGCFLCPFDPMWAIYSAGTELFSRMVLGSVYGSPCRFFLVEALLRATIFKEVARVSRLSGHYQGFTPIVSNREIYFPSMFFSTSYD